MYLVKEYFQLHFIVLLWGFSAILGLLIKIPVVEMVFYRTLIASFALGLIVYFGQNKFNIGYLEIVKILSVGILFAAHWILFFASARLSTASIALVGYATSTFWTSLFEPLITRGKIKLYEVIMGLVVLVGIYIIFRVEFDYFLGLTLAIACGFLAAIFFVLNKKFTEKYDYYTITFYEMTGACLSIALFLPLYRQWFTVDSKLHLNPDLMDWLYLAILSLVCTVFTISTAIKLMRKLSAYSINLVTNMEPVYGIILALLIFGEKEKMSIEFYYGTTIILLTVLSYPIINRNQRRKALPIDKLR